MSAPVAPDVTDQLDAAAHTLRGEAQVLRSIGAGDLGDRVAALADECLRRADAMWEGQGR